MRTFFLSLTRHPLSLAGTGLALASAVVILTLLGLDLMGVHGSPYLGILAFLVLPAILILGLAVVPVGIWLDRRRSRRAEATGEAEAAFPVIDLNRDRTRRVAIGFLAASVVNVVILAVATFKAVEVMDSNAFCGQTCDTVMAPEYTTYQRSPHARVKCVECHIGPGAGWFVKSKLSGSWQVVSVAFDLYPRPIPAPVHNLRPARETCEQCHWPSKFVGDRLKVLTRYGEDEHNTPSKTVLLLRVGGIQGRVSQGIHWHVDPNIQVRYRADESRETIHEVELTLADGTVKLYRGPGYEEAQASEDLESEWRLMDCVDCHNRPTHIYRLPPEELDDAIEDGRIARGLPYVRREGFRLLQAEYASHEDAARRIREEMEGFYRDSHPEVLEGQAGELEEAIRTITSIWTTNVHPSMNIGWGTYPNHIGHENAPGCFRCHNDEHATEDGETISMDCDTCHTLLAMEEEEPEVLQMLNP